jgi:hypothetical protein
MNHLKVCIGFLHTTYRMVLKVHRDTLNNIQRFWHVLMHKTVRFKTLADSVQAMDGSIRQADRVYK